jgi:uncharacterized iron-regulated protein
MLTKESVLATVNSFKETISVDDLIERIIMLEKIEVGLKQSESGEVITEVDLEKRMEEWFV